MPGVTQEESAGFRSMYDEGSSVAQISRHFGRSSYMVYRHLKRSGQLRSPMEGLQLASRQGRLQGGRGRGMAFDDAVYECELDSRSAWALGLIYGDGSLHPNGRLQVACGPDRDVAEKLTKMFVSGYEPRFKDNCWLFEVYSHRVMESLAIHGLTPGSKTYTMEFPEVPDELLPHFVRGLWESDGSMGLRSGVLKYASASHGFVESLRDVLYDRVQVNRAKLGTNKNDNCMTIAYGSGTAVRLAKWLYASSESKMRCDRKWSIFQQLVRGG